MMEFTLSKQGQIAMGLAVVGISTAMCFPASAQQQPAPTPRTIMTQVGEPSFAAFKPYWIDRPVMEVIGRASREFEPNKAQLSFKFEATDKLADEALSIVSRAARGAIERVERLAGNKVAISASSTREDFFEQYRDRAGNKIENERPDKIERSTVRWTVTLKLSDLTLVSRARAEMLNAVGATQEGDVYFTLTPSEAQTRSVMAAALEDGRERARMMSALHTGRTRLLVVQEGASQCLSQATTPPGETVMLVSGRSASAPPPPPPPPQGGKSRLSSDLVFPAAPDPTTLSASVCLIYGLD